MDELPSRLQDLVVRLRARGGRITPQRMAILRALLESDHPTVDAIYEHVKREFPMTSLVTVYRTVAALRDMGEALEVHSADPVAHYDGLRPYEHAHIVCVACGRVIDAPALDPAALTAGVRRECRDWVLGEEVHFYGICPACQPSGAPVHAKGGEAKDVAAAPSRPTSRDDDEPWLL